MVSLSSREKRRLSQPENPGDEPIERKNGGHTRHNDTLVIQALPEA
jgi:hypothetical protein